MKMTKKQQQAENILRHGFQLLRIFPNANIQGPVMLCKALRRIETKASSYATSECNGYPVPEDWHEKILKKVSALLNPGAVPLYVNGDPRGYTLKIRDEYVREKNLEIYRDWGGYGILAPEF